MMSEEIICWFCDETVKPTDDAYFCMEFDAIYHSKCGGHEKCQVCTDEGVNPCWPH
jgi:hypothetical protein